MFPIRRAGAEVSLPGEAATEGSIYFTGPYGSRDRNANSTSIDGGHRVLFERTRPLAPHEGLTVGVKISKGEIAPATGMQAFRWYLRDRTADVLSVGGLALVLTFYLWALSAPAWIHVGRDPRKSVVVPRWNPPDAVAPAIAHYIWNKGLKSKGFSALSAAAINLAV
jgi:hypothetical protein